MKIICENNELNRRKEAGGRKNIRRDSQTLWHSLRLRAINTVWRVVVPARDMRSRELTIYSSGV